MGYLIENWYVFVGIAAVIFVAVVMAVKFFNMPTEKQKEALREWLKYGVSVAEKDLGGGTGQLKLRKVYNMAISKFPWVATIYSFDKFSQDVDDALKWLDEQLNNNKNIKAIIAGEEKENGSDKNTD